MMNDPYIGRRCLLSWTEYEAALAHADAIADAYERAGMYRRGTMSEEDPRLLHRRGVPGQLAFYRIFGLSTDRFFEDTRARRARDDVPDAILWGKTIDVKTVRSRFHRLIIAKWQGDSPTKPKPDGYALMVGIERGPYTLAGFIRADALIRDDRVIDLGRGPTYAANVWQLREFFELWAASNSARR